MTNSLIAKLILSAPCFLLSAAVAWGCWGPIRSWMFAQIPGGEYAGLLKLISLGMIGYFGGIGIPLALFVLGCVVFLLDI